MGFFSPLLFATVTVRVDLLLTALGSGLHWKKLGYYPQEMMIHVHSTYKITFTPLGKVKGEKNISVAGIFY